MTYVVWLVFLWANALLGVALLAAPARSQSHLINFDSAPVQSPFPTDLSMTVAVYDRHNLLASSKIYININAAGLMTASANGTSADVTKASPEQTSLGLPELPPPEKTGVSTISSRGASWTREEWNNYENR